MAQGAHYGTEKNKDETEVTYPAYKELRRLCGVKGTLIGAGLLLMVGSAACSDTPRRHSGRTAGVPMPVRMDSDKDGLYDDEDSCPHKPGPRVYSGCPVPQKNGRMKAPEPPKKHDSEATDDL